MSGTLKYKATERYSLGWTDPRGIFGRTGVEGVKIGDYYLSELGSVSDTVMHLYHDGYVLRADKEEFATLIEAFLKEKKDGESNTVQRGDEAGLRPQHHFGKSEG
jgi:hypothetical protein